MVGKMHWYNSRLLVPNVTCGGLFGVMCLVALSLAMVRGARLSSSTSSYRYTSFFFYIFIAGLSGARAAMFFLIPTTNIFWDVPAQIALSGIPTLLFTNVLMWLIAFWFSCLRMSYPDDSRFAHVMFYIAESRRLLVGLLIFDGVSAAVLVEAQYHRSLEVVAYILLTVVYLALALTLIPLGRRLYSFTQLDSVTRRSTLMMIVALTLSLVVRGLLDGIDIVTHYRPQTDPQVQRLFRWTRTSLTEVLYYTLLELIPLAIVLAALRVIQRDIRSREAGALRLGLKRGSGVSLPPSAVGSGAQPISPPISPGDCESLLRSGQGVPQPLARGLTYDAAQQTLYGSVSV